MGTIRGIICALLMTVMSQGCTPRGHTECFRPSQFATICNDRKEGIFVEDVFFDPGRCIAIDITTSDTISCDEEPNPDVIFNDFVISLQASFPVLIVFNESDFIRIE